MGRHRYQRPVGQTEIAVVAELLDARKDVIPASAIEPRRMPAELVENFIHFERREYRLDEHRRLDRSARHAEHVLCSDEDVVPQPRLQVAFELRQIEIRSGPARHKLLGIVEEVKGEIEDAAGDHLAVDLDVLFWQMPPAWTNKKRGGLVVELVGLSFRADVIDFAANGVAQIEMAL